MGRHSAPEDDGDLLVAPVESPRPSPRPRHAVPDADADVEATDVIEPELVERALDAPPRDVVDADVVEDDRHTEPVAEIAPPRPSPKPKRERPSRTDLRLLRGSASLRARCAAALLVPFIVYTIVLVVISRVDIYLFWIWIPAILAGVLFGAQLDAANKKATTPTE